jgi:hypothetical protein
MGDWKAGKKDISNNTNTAIDPIWHKNQRLLRVEKRAFRCARLEA